MWQLRAYGLQLLELLAILLLLSSCTVGPVYQKPTVELPSHWSRTRIGSNGSATDLTEWWKGFRDPKLDALVREAIAGNLNLKLAEARINEAYASRVATASAFWPTLTGSASGTRFHGSASSLGGSGLIAGGLGGGGGHSPSALPTGSAFTENLYNTNVTANWAPDLFGGTRRSVQSATANLQAEIDDRRSTLVSLLGELATDYVTLRGAQARLKVADDMLASERDTLALTESKFNAGLASALDVAQARGAVATTLAAIPSLRTTAREAMHELSVLTGLAPETLIPELNGPAPIPVMTTATELDPPAELLRRRPDIRAAERRVAAASANIGVAVANEYPSFTLIGSVGLNASRISQLGDTSARTWWFGPSLNLPIFNAGKLAAQVNVQRALWDQAVITYRKTVLNAVEQVENAITAYEGERGHNTALKQSVAADHQALALSQDLYRKGLVNFLNVLDAERALYGANDQLVQSDEALSTDLISLFQALGGGWTPREATPSSQDNR